MKDEHQTKEQLIDELAELRQRIAALEASEAERKRAEEALQESEEKYRTILESIEEGYYEVDIVGNFTFFNDALCEILGYSRDEMMGMNNRQYMDKENAEKVYQTFNGVYTTGKPAEGFDWEIIRKDGTKRFVEASVSLMRNSEGERMGFRGIVRNITARKRAEEALRKSEDKYRTLFESKLDGVCVIDETMKLLLANQAAADMFGLDSVEEMLDLNPFDFISPEERERVLTIITKDMFGNNLQQVNEFRLMNKAGEEIWISAVGTATEYEGKLAGLVSFRDITARKRAEEELRQSYVKLQKALEGTVNTLISAIEMKDPYTAGHQRRVTQLACAMAKEMGLPEEQIEGLRMAGLIHDIGKMSVPAEILSKPGRLSELEYGLIQAHAQVGYDVLNGTIEFPWPVAQIVLQHHERMDGSGYPQGLSGEEIMLEARILGVADVIEAMASHRPYRPPRGLDKALEEMSGNRGVLYDPEVVDACLKLFTEKGFKFE